MANIPWVSLNLKQRQRLNQIGNSHRRFCLFHPCASEALHPPGLWDPPRSSMVAHSRRPLHPCIPIFLHSYIPNMIRVNPCNPQLNKKAEIWLLTADSLCPYIPTYLPIYLYTYIPVYLYSYIPLSLSHPTFKAPPPKYRGQTRFTQPPKKHRCIHNFLP